MLAIPAPVRAQERAGSWYWCEAARGYYPQVSSCPGGWREVQNSPSAPRAPTIALPEAAESDYNPIPPGWNIEVRLPGFITVGGSICTSAGKCTEVGSGINLDLCRRDPDANICVSSRLKVDVLAISPSGSTIVHVNGGNYAVSGLNWRKKRPDGSEAGGPILVVYRGALVPLQSISHLLPKRSQQDLQAAAAAQKPLKSIGGPVYGQATCASSGAVPKSPDPAAAHKILEWVKQVEASLELPIPVVPNDALRIQSLIVSWQNEARRDSVEYIFRSAVSHGAAVQYETLMLSADPSHRKDHQFWIDAEAARATACLALTGK